MVVSSDFIKRLIEQLAGALAALVGARRKKDWGEAEHLLREASLSLFGLEYGMLTRFDAASVAQLLAHPERVKALAELVLEDAKVQEEKGHTEEAERLRTHAALLQAEAARMLS